MKKELWVGVGSGSVAATFTLIVAVIIQVSGDRPDYSKIIAFPLLAGVGGFMAGSLGAFVALPGESGQPPRDRATNGDRGPTQHPVDSLKLLGDTREEQWLAISAHSAATHAASPRELTGLLAQVGRITNPTLPTPAGEFQLPTPPQAIATELPRPRYENPPIADLRAPDSTPAPYLHGEEVEIDNLWDDDDSMSASYAVDLNEHPVDVFADDYRG